MKFLKASETIPRFFAVFCCLQLALNNRLLKQPKGTFTLSVSVNSATTLTPQINFGLQPIYGAACLVFQEICKQLIGAISIARLPD